MLTKRQNFLETIRGGNPDRFVKGYEALPRLPVGAPLSKRFPSVQQGGPPVKNAWGVTYTWPEHVYAGMPDHINKENIVIKDIAHWKDYVTMPETNFPEEEWQPLAEACAAVDRNEVFCGITVAPGLFEMCHHTMSMDVACANMLLEPEHMKDLIKYFLEYEMKFAEQLIKYTKLDLMLHHDDWGGQSSTFFSPAMFDDFFLDAYKQIYSYYKANGVEIVVHHSDSYAATLVPQMIEIGADVWQGGLKSNNIPELVKQYGGKMSFMGGINNGIVDVPGWTREIVRKEVEELCRACGKLYIIPCMTAGATGGYYGVGSTVDEEIDRMSELMF
ncbi:MAG: uroporphyrinogen decarboxylase [Eubacteriaceae bacterium]|nr:uroporphyrinogen decarboxylase [Eubacteriaceae bacterium]